MMYYEFMTKEKENFEWPIYLDSSITKQKVDFSFNFV